MSEFGSNDCFVVHLALNLLEKLLELDPKKRISARAALNHRYFRAEPLVPSDPSELGTIDLGDGNDGSGYHEFQTKKRRREAKAVAKQAEDEAKRRGEDVEKQREAFDKAYREHLKRGAERDKEKTKMKEKLEKHKRELEIQDQELQLEMQMFPQQKELEKQQEGLQRMQQQYNPPPQRHQGGWNTSQHHPSNPQRQQYDRSWNPEQSRHQSHPDDRFNPSYENQSYPQQQRDRFNQQPNRHAQMDDRRQNAPPFDRSGTDGWRQRSSQLPYDRDAGDNWQHQNRQQPPSDRNGAEDRQPRSEHLQQWNRSHPEQQQQQRQFQQDQRPSFERDTADQWRQGYAGNRQQSQSNQQFERNQRFDDRYGSRQQPSFDRGGRRDQQQSSFDRDGRRDQQQSSFDHDGRRDQQQRPLNRNYEDNRYGTTHQGSYDRDGRSGYSDGSNQNVQPSGDRRATAGGPPHWDNRPDEYRQTDRYNQRADADRTIDDPGRKHAQLDRRDNRPPGDRYGGSGFRNDGNRRSDGWEDRKRAGHYGDPRRDQDPHHSTRNEPSGGQTQNEGFAGGRNAAANDQRSGLSGHNNGKEVEQALMDESSQNIHDPLLETEISLEAAEDLILRDFGGKGGGDYEKHQSSRKHDDMKTPRELSSSRHGRHRERERSAERERRHRHRDKSDDSREHRRSHKHHHRHRSRDDDHHKSREGKVDSESNDAAHAEHSAVDSHGKDRSSSAKRDGKADDEYQRASEHRSSSRHRKRDGDDSSYRDHRHKRSRHDDRNRSDRHRSRDNRYSSERHERRRPDHSGGGREYAPPTNSEYDRFGNPRSRRDD
jgi:hypothetical protein